MAEESKFEKLLSKVHQGVPLEKPAEKAVPSKEAVKPAEKEDAAVGNVTVEVQEQAGSTIVVKPATEVTAQKNHEVKVEPAVQMPAEQSAKSSEKRKRKPQHVYNN